jgi:hypothetical protein
LISLACRFITAPIVTLSYLVDTVISPPLSVSSSHRQGELFARSSHGNSTKGYQLRSRGQQRPVTGVGAGPDPYVLDEHVHRRGHGRSGRFGFCRCAAPSRSPESALHAALKSIFQVERWANGDIGDRLARRNAVFRWRSDKPSQVSGGRGARSAAASRSAARGGVGHLAIQLATASRPRWRRRYRRLR